MKVYVFQTSNPRSNYGFTLDPTGANLPTDKGPWLPFKSLDMNSGETPRIGVNTDEVLMAIADRGFYVTAATLKWEVVG